VANGQAQARSYPLHSNEGGSKTDSYVWWKVRLTDENGAGRNVKLEVLDGGAYKLVADRVFFDVHDHFDPEFLWYSDYTPPGQTSPGVVQRPQNAANATSEGWLLVAVAKLQSVGIDPTTAGGTTRAPKWPKTTG
jgi:hypothetical protein